MKKVIFEFVNNNGQTKKGYAWLDEDTYKMICKLDEITRVNYLREIYYEQIYERKYKRRISSLEEICAPKENADGEDITFEFSDQLDIEEVISDESKIKEIAFLFNKEEKEFIREIFINKVTEAEFAIKKGVCQQNISRKVRRIKEKLQKNKLFLDLV